MVIIPALMLISHQTDVHPMLDQCCASVVDAGPTLNQYWVEERAQVATTKSICDTLSPDGYRSPPGVRWAAI